MKRRRTSAKARRRARGRVPIAWPVVTYRVNESDGSVRRCVRMPPGPMYERLSLFAWREHAERLQTVAAMDAACSVLLADVVAACALPQGDRRRGDALDGFHALRELRAAVARDQRAHGIPEWDL